MRDEICSDCPKRKSCELIPGCCQCTDLKKLAISMVAKPRKKPKTKTTEIVIPSIS